MLPFEKRVAGGSGQGNRLLGTRCFLEALAVVPTTLFFGGCWFPLATSAFPMKTLGELALCVKVFEPLSVFNRLTVFP